MALLSTFELLTIVYLTLSNLRHMHGLPSSRLNASVTNINKTVGRSLEQSWISAYRDSVQYNLQISANNGTVYVYRITNGDFDNAERKLVFEWK